LLILSPWRMTFVLWVVPVRNYDPVCWMCILWCL